MALISPFKFLKEKLAHPKFLENAKLTIGDQTSIKHAVQQGLGISIVSKHLVEMDRLANQVHVLEIEGFRLERLIQVVYNKNSPIKESMKNFMTTVS